MSYRTHAIRRLVGDPPVSPGRSLEAFANARSLKCPGCSGLGWTIVPGQRMDPIEGSKMCDKQKCSACHGSCKVRVSDFYDQYHVERDRYKRRREEWLDRKRRVSTALSKLNEDDIEALRLL